MNQEENPMKDYTIIPPNRSGTGKIKSLPLRNLIEGAIESFLLCYPVVVIIPFTVRVKVILVISLSICIVIANIIGVQQKSYTQALMDWIHDRKQYQTLKLGSVADEKNGIADSEDTNNQSIFKGITRYIGEEIEAENSGRTSSNQALFAKILRAIIKIGKNFKDNTGF